jgi:acyltransferase
MSFQAVPEIQSSSPTTAFAQAKRVDWADAAKGLGMILVVFGHIPLFGMPKTVEFIYLFHLPLFFLLAGLFQERSQQEGEFMGFLRHKCRLRLSPYFSFCAVSLATFLWLTARLWPPVDIQHSVSSVVWSMVAGRPEINVALWFFPGLFCAELLAYPFLRFNRWAGIAAAVTLAAVLSLPWVDLSHIPGFFKAGVGLVALPLLLLGHHLREGLHALVRQKPAVLLTLALVALAITYGLGPAVGRVNMMSGTYRQLALFYVCGLSGSLSVICLAGLLRRVRLLRAIGAASAVIFPLHLLFRPFITVDVEMLLDQPCEMISSSVALGLVYLVLMIGFPLGIMQLANALANRWLRLNLKPALATA